MRKTTPVCELANPRLVYFIWNGDVVEQLVDIGGSVALHCGQVVEGEEEQILRLHLSKVLNTRLFLIGSQGVAQ